jgi:hypothetical protein
MFRGRTSRPDPASHLTRRYTLKHILLTSIAGSSLLLFGLTAAAQQYPPPSGYFDRGQTADRAQFFEHVRADLDRAESTASSSTGDLNRIEGVREAMNFFQRKMDDGNYDPRALTDTIVSVQRVLDNNTLYVHARAALSDDLGRLRDMRDQLDNWR